MYKYLDHWLKEVPHHTVFMSLKNKLDSKDYSQVSCTPILPALEK